MDTWELVSDIKLLLGDGVVRLEVTDDDIESLVKFAFKKIKPYIADLRLFTFPAQRCVDLTSRRVLEVVRLYPSTAVFSDSTAQVPDGELIFDFQVYRNVSSLSLSNIKQNILKRYSVEDVTIPFEFEDGKLYISVGSVYNSVTAECVVDVTIEELKDERAIAWIQSYALALTKERIGRIRSKYKSTNIPVEIDGDSLLQEAREEKAKLEQDLENKDFGPGFVLR